MDSKLHHKPFGKYKGYALLLSLLIVVVIGMIMYFKWMYGPVYEIGKGKSGINPPWRQWQKLRIRIENEPVGRPSAEQNQLQKPLLLETYCKLEDKEKGEIQVVINPDGEIQGIWTGTFYMNKNIEFQVMACQFKGTIDPQEIYRDANGINTSKLFLIAKGPFTILEINHKNGVVRNLMGSAYLRSWLDKDNFISGELIISSDDKNFYRYSVNGLAKATEQIPVLLPWLD